jgi:hypothetical protein
MMDEPVLHVNEKPATGNKKPHQPSRLVGSRGSSLTGHVLLAEMMTPQILEIGAETRVDLLTERFRSG